MRQGGRVEGVWCAQYIGDSVARAIASQGARRMPGCRTGITLSRAPVSTLAWRAGAHVNRVLCASGAPYLGLPYQNLHQTRSEMPCCAAACSSMLADRVFCGHGRGRGANPLAHVLQAIDEPLDLMEYNSWNVVLPEGQFPDRGWQHPV